MAQRSYESGLLHNVQYVGSSQYPYEVNWARALAAGLLATDALMILLYTVPPLFGMEPVDVAGMTGGLFAPQGGVTAFWIGLAVQMALSTASVLVYAAALLLVRRDSSWSSGAAFGLLLGCLGPITILSLVLQRSPFVQEGLIRNPGVLLLQLGTAPVLFLLFAHLIYGVIAGALYRHVQTV